jgi:hypothetical protein
VRVLAIRIHVMGANSSTLAKYTTLGKVLLQVEQSQFNAQRLMQDSFVTGELSLPAHKYVERSATRKDTVAKRQKVSDPVSTLS